MEDWNVKSLTIRTNDGASDATDEEMTLRVDSFAVGGFIPPATTRKPKSMDKARRKKKRKQAAASRRRNRGRR